MKKSSKHLNEYLLNKRIIQVLKENSRGLPISMIAKKTGTNRFAAAKSLAELKGAGIVAYEEIGPCKVYYIKEEEQ
jgi:DNA-binding Lrp family transcriptional regulator